MVSGSVKTASRNTDRFSTGRAGGTPHPFDVGVEFLDPEVRDDFKYEEGLCRPATVRRRNGSDEVPDGDFDGDFRRLIEEAEEQCLHGEMLSAAGAIDMRELFEDPELQSALNLLMCMRAIERDCTCDHSEHEYCEICCMKIAPGMILAAENDHQGGQVTIRISDEAACSEKIGFITRGQLNWLRGRYTQGKTAVLQERN